MDNRIIQLLKLLSEAKCPSGFEIDIFDIVSEYCHDFAEVTYDSLYNVFITPFNSKGKHTKCLLEAHSDEVGFIVSSINSNGTLNFTCLGGIHEKILPGSTLLLKSMDGIYLTGIISSTSPHFLKTTDVQLSNQLVIDIGATCYEEAVQKFRIGIGCIAVPKTEFCFDFEYGLLFGKAFDNRIGCAVVMETLRQLSEVGADSGIVGLLSSQEELGMRGVKHAMKKIKADYAICFEGCPADDTVIKSELAQTSLKKGPMVRYMDKAMVANPKYIEWVIKNAKEGEISLQLAVRTSGGTDGAVINNDYGIPTIVIGVPVRYAHTCNSISSLSDLHETINLGKRLAQYNYPEY